jgi:hypothetical protein
VATNDKRNPSNLLWYSAKAATFTWSDGGSFAPNVSITPRRVLEEPGPKVRQRSQPPQFDFVNALMRTLLVLILACHFSLMAGEFKLLAVCPDLEWAPPSFDLDIRTFEKILNSSMTNRESTFTMDKGVSGVFFTEDRRCYYWNIHPPRSLFVSNPRTNNWVRWNILEFEGLISSFSTQAVPKVLFQAPRPPITVANHTVKDQPVESPMVISNLIVNGKVNILTPNRARAFQIPQAYQGNFKGSGYLLDSRTNIYYWNRLSDQSAVIRDRGGTTAIVTLSDEKAR